MKACVSWRGWCWVSKPREEPSWGVLLTLYRAVPGRGRSRTQVCGALLGSEFPVLGGVQAEVPLSDGVSLGARVGGT